MRERLERRFSDFQKAVNNLETAIESVVDDLDIDGAIKRFELCYDLSWKLMKDYLGEQGIIVRNPRACFKEAYANGLIQDEFAWMEMIEDRNLLVHVYTFEESRKIFEKVQSKHAPLLCEFYETMQKVLEST